MNNFPPILSTTRGEVEIGDSLRLSSLVDYFDNDGNPATQYQIRDNGTLSSGGFLVVNGTRQAAGIWITVSAQVFESVRYQAGLIEATESFSVRAFDGQFWSSIAANQLETITPNLDAPVVIGTPGTVLAREEILFSDLFRVTDADANSTVERYRIVDRRTNRRGGRFSLDGVDQAQGFFFEVAAEDIDTLNYRAATWGFQAENVGIQAFDGRFWSAVTNFTIGTTRNVFQPDAVAVDRVLGTNQTVGLNTLFSASDRDGNTIKTVGIFETGPVPSGSFRANGQTLAPQQWHIFDFEDIGSVTYQAAATNSRENFRVRVFDGSFWSSADVGSLTTVVRPELDTPTTEFFVDTLEAVDILDVVAANGIVYDSYTIIDENPAPGSGRITFQNQAQAQGTELTFTRGQVNNVDIRGGAGDDRRSDSYLIRGFANGQATDWQRVVVNTEPVNTAAFDSGLSLRNFHQDPDGITRVPYAFLSGNSAPLYYAPDADEHDGTSDFTFAQQEVTRSVLQSFSEIANIEFVEVPYNPVGQNYSLLFGAFDQDGPGSVLGFTILPFTSGLGDAVADVWLDTGDFPTNGTGDIGLGSQFRSTLIHEVLHTVGAKHPFLDSAPPGTPPFLPTSTNQLHFSALSNVTDFGFFPEEPSTPVLYDVLYLQQQYGANQTTNLGNTQHFFDEAHLQYIYDAGGIDTINYTSDINSNFIDLHQGTYSSIRGQQNALLIPLGTEIENARGGRGNDLLFGNEVRNLLFGNEGDDTLRGFGGSDVLRGGAGDDTYFLTVGDGRDTVREERSGGVDVVAFGDITGRLDSLTQDLIAFRRGNDLRIDLRLDGGPIDASVTLTDQANNASRVETLRLFDNGGLQIGPDIDVASIFTGASSSGTRFELTPSSTDFGFIAAPV